MRYIRILVVILFIASLGIYGAARIREQATEDPTRPVITSDREELESLHFLRRKRPAGRTDRRGRKRRGSDGPDHGRQLLPVH